MNNVQIDVVTQYIEDQSKPDQDYYVFSYTITILNRGDEPVKLINRHWVITDSNQKIQEVRGEGVVGEQPYLKPGEQFAYTSGSVLETSVGTMQGSYEMRTDDGSMFDAPINEFVLSTPRVLH
ncbi:MAG: Co2+/Mg2+ efflux protein ApaG [Gammaproteobacteria bacterium]|nr:Co2+/Mg2+ efflux protein ApaG [Gammaproteobacteria bacterium]